MSKIFVTFNLLILHHTSSLNFFFLLGVVFFPTYFQVKLIGIYIDQYFCQWWFMKDNIWIMNQWIVRVSFFKFAEDGKRKNYVIQRFLNQEFLLVI
jgi:hypothetical protein